MLWCEFETLREREREFCGEIWWKDGGGVLKSGSEVIVWVSELVSMVALLSLSSKSSITWVGIWKGARVGEVSVGEVSEQVTVWGVTIFTKFRVSGILDTGARSFSGG